MKAYHDILNALQFFGPLQTEELRRKLEMKLKKPVGRTELKIHLNTLVDAKKIRVAKIGNGFLYTKMGGIE